MTDETRKQLWIEKPWVRGTVNGVFFGVALAVINVMGLFGEARPLTQDAVVEYILAGIVFGFVVYILQFWKETRRMKAEALARDAQEKKEREE